MNPKIHTPSPSENSEVKKGAPQNPTKRRTRQELMAVLAVGQKVAYLTILRHLTIKTTNRSQNRNVNRTECICDCGKMLIVNPYSLLNGDSQSCGCMRGALITSANTQHGESRTPEYKSWSGMLNRCYREDHDSYPYYGGRGITVCSRWRRSVNAFVKDMGRRPTPRHSIDRINSNGNYEPGNCRWATSSEQQNNRRDTRFVEFEGKRISVTHLAAKKGIDRDVLSTRIFQSGWSLQEALTRPVATRLCH